MAESGSEKRQRKVIRTVRFTTFEDAIVVVKADIAGLSVASCIRQSILHMPPPSAAHRPTVNYQLAVQLLAEIGRLTTAFDHAAEGHDGVDAALIETAFRDVSEMRLVLLESIGRAP